jgi:hypothetical protein
MELDQLWTHKEILVMKNKNEEEIRPSSAVPRKQVEYYPGPTDSWLRRVAGDDEETRTCQERSMASEVFLKSWLFPRQENREPLDESALVDLLVDFKQSREDLDVDFEMAQIVARLLGRFQCYQIDDNDALLLSDSLARELDLFASLAELDFQSIDETVRSRLQSE